MGMGTNIVIFLLVTSIVFWMIGYPPVAANFLACFSNQLVPLNETSGQPLGSCLVGGTSIEAALGVILVGGAIVLAATSFFPNPYTLFAIAAIVLLGLVTFPAAVLTGMNVGWPFRVLFTGVYGVLITLAVLSWHRGSGEF